MPVPRSVHAGIPPVESMEILFDAPSRSQELEVRSDYLDFLKDAADRPFPWQQPYEERRRNCSSPRMMQQVVMDDQWNESFMYGFWRRLRRYCIPREDWQVPRDLLGLFLSEVGVSHHVLQDKLFGCFQPNKETYTYISRAAGTWEDAARISQMRYECRAASTSQRNDETRIQNESNFLGGESPAPGITFALLSSTLFPPAGEAASATPAGTAAAVKDSDAQHRRAVPSVNALYMCKTLERALTGSNRDAILKHCFSRFRIYLSDRNTLSRRKLRALAQSYLPPPPPPPADASFEQNEEQPYGTPVSPEPAVVVKPTFATVARDSASSRIPLSRADVIKRCEAAGLQIVPPPPSAARGKGDAGSTGGSAKRKAKPVRTDASGLTGDSMILAEQVTALDMYFTTIESKAGQTNTNSGSTAHAANGSPPVNGGIASGEANPDDDDDMGDEYEVTEEMFRSAFFDVATHGGELSGVFAKPLLEAAATFLRPPFGTAPAVPLRWTASTVPIPHDTTCVHSADAPLLRLVEMAGNDPNVVETQPPPKKGKKGKSSKSKGPKANKK